MPSSDDQKGAGAPPQGSPRSTALAPVGPQRRMFGRGGNPPPPRPPDGGDGDEEDDGMLRMSFLEHLEELRARIIRAVLGVGVAFIVSLSFCDWLWGFVCQPAVQALKTLHYDPELVQIA